MIIAPSVHHISLTQRILSHVCGKPVLSAGGSSLQLRGGDFLKYSVIECHYKKTTSISKNDGLTGSNQQLRFGLMTQVKS